MALRSSNLLVSEITNSFRGLVSARLVEAEILDWRLFRVSDQRLIKWFGKSCPLFELGLHLTVPCQLPYPHQLFTYNSPITYCYHETCISYLCSIENPLNVHLNNFQRHWKWPLLIAYLLGLKCLKGRKCNFRVNRELIQCFM